MAQAWPRFPSPRKAATRKPPSATPALRNGSTVVASGPPGARVRARGLVGLTDRGPTRRDSIEVRIPRKPALALRRDDLAPTPFGLVTSTSQPDARRAAAVRNVRDIRG